MHEYALVRALLRSVAEKATAHEARAVRTVRVRVGALAGVEPELFATAFAQCRGTVPLCATAELVVAADEALWRCRDCGVEIGAGEALACPVCRGPAQLAQGDALRLEGLELEVSDDV